MIWLTFGVGLFLGVFVGVVLMALLTIAKKGGEDAEEK